MMSELDREGTPGTLDVEIIQEVACNRQRQEAAWNLNRKRCGGMCGRTITQILR